MGTPTPFSAPTTRRALTIATAVSLVAAPLLASSPAQAVDTTPLKVKVVKIAPKAFPRLLDRPGTTGDVLRFTLVPGAVWKVGATEVKFEGANKTADVPVTGTSVTATVGSVPNTTTNSFTISGPSSFTYAPTNVAKVYSKTEIESALTWLDMPGTKSDAVTLTKLNGIVWDVAGVKYDEAKFGAKTSIVVKLKPGAKVKPEVLGATLAADVPAEHNGVTDTAVIEYTPGQLAAAAVTGDNPFDKTKGVGKSASVETVKVTGLAGVSWKVGSSPKAVNVKPGVVAYLPVLADDLENSTSVAVTPVAATGFKVPAATAPATGGAPVSVPFADDTTAPVVLVPAVIKGEASGTVADTLKLTGARGLTWFVGQADTKGKLAYKPLKVGKDGFAVYKVKHGKDGKPAAVNYRAVAERGYEVSDKAVKTASFTTDETSVPTSSITTGNVTLAAVSDGVASWVVANTIAEKVVKTTYKPSELVAAGAQSMIVPASTIEVKRIKGYKQG